MRNGQASSEATLRKKPASKLRKEPRKAKPAPGPTYANWGTLWGRLPTCGWLPTCLWILINADGGRFEIGRRLATCPPCRPYPNSQTANNHFFIEVCPR